MTGDGEELPGSPGVTGADARIRRILDEFGQLAVAAASLEKEANLYQVGMSSHASVNVMLAVEDEFEIEFPEHLLRKSTFESIEAIGTTVAEIIADRVT